MLNQRETELANQRYQLLSNKVAIDKALEINEIQLQEVQRLKSIAPQPEPPQVENPIEEKHEEPIF